MQKKWSLVHTLTYSRALFFGHLSLDEHANPFQSMNSASSLTDDFVPDLMDIPIGMVNACLYQHIEGISDEEEDPRDDDMMEDDEDYEGSYFDDGNVSDWDDQLDM